MRGTPLSTVSAPCMVLMSASEAHSRVAGKDAAAAKQRLRSRAAGAAPPAPLPALPTVPRAANPAATQQPKFWLGAPEAVHPRYDRLQHADMDLDEARALRQRLQRAYQPRRPRQRMPAAFLGTFQRRANHSCLPPPARGAPRPAEQNAAADLAAQGAPAVAAAEGGADADAGPPAAAAIDRVGEPGSVFARDVAVGTRGEGTVGGLADGIGEERDAAVAKDELPAAGMAACEGAVAPLRGTDPGVHEKNRSSGRCVEWILRAAQLIAVPEGE